MINEPLSFWLRIPKTAEKLSDGSGPVEEWQAALAKQLKATSGIWVGGHNQVQFY